MNTTSMQKAMAQGTAYKVVPNQSEGIVLDNLESIPKFSVWGGGRLTNQSYCTSGFTVKNATGVLGVSTAEHCISENHWRTIGAANRLTLVNKIVNRDVAWFRTPSTVTVPTNRIQISSSTFRTINGTQVAKVGNAICKYGQTTGYNCGVVSAVGFTAPVGPHPVTGGMVNIVNLIEVTKNGAINGGALTRGGDSGGPWFISSKAVGTTVAGDIGSGDTGTYVTPVSNITAMGVSILTQ